MTFNMLIVDDSFSMRSVIRKIITLSGFKMDQCYEAQNGREALEVLSKQWVDVIISDINMPEMNGIEFLKQLKQDNLFKEIPVIFVTTEGSKERIQEAIDSGAGGFLKKPFLPEELRKLLCDLVGLSEEGQYEQESGENDSLDF
jgi:two-component system, chemotaxis family, chemotaxis protein CheY